MPNRDLFNNIKTTQVLVNAVATGTVTSSAIDLQGFDSAAVLFDVGNSGDTLSGSLYWTLSLTESDSSGSGYTTVAAADIQVQGGTFGTDNTFVIDAPLEDSLLVKFGYLGSKRYLKAVATAMGSHSTGTPIGIISVLGNPAQLPVS